MYTTKSYLGFESRSLRNEGSRSRKWPAAMIFLRRKLACKAAGKSLRPDGLQGPSAAPSVARAPAASREGMRSVSEHNPVRVGSHRLPHPLQGPLRRAVRECAASASTIPAFRGHRLPHPLQGPRRRRAYMGDVSTPIGLAVQTGRRQGQFYG